MRLGFSILATLLVSAAALGQQQAGVELRLESRTLEEGEMVDGQIICTNIGDPTTPQPTVPEGLELRLASSTPFRSSMTSIVNGRRTDATTITFGFRLTAKKAGQYTLGPVMVQAGGATYQSNAVPIKVQRSDAVSSRDGDKLVFARISVKPASLYVTQSFEATLTIAIRRFEMDGRVVDLGNLLQLVDAGGSDLSSFGTRFTPSETTLTDSSGIRHSYAVYRQTREVRAEKVGTMPVRPVFLKVNYPVSIRRSWLGGYEAAEARRETARADAINVEVKGPPAEGRPADFTGAIGRYELAATAKPDRAELGQPVTLSIGIKGEPLDGIAGPDLARIPDLVSRFDFTKDELTGDEEGNTRVFRRAIFPRQVGEQTIPSLSWSYFDPQKEAYVSLTTAPIPITVDPSTAQPPGVAGSEEAPSSSGTTLTVLTGGLSPNYVDARRVLANQAFALGSVEVIGVVAVPPLFWLVATLATRRRMRLRSDPLVARRHRAGRAARSRIGAALRSPESGKQFDGLAEAMTGFLSDRFGLPPGELTPNDARALLCDRGAGSIAAEVANFLETCDAVRFAHGATDGLSSSEAAEQVKRWIAEIDKCAK